MPVVAFEPGDLLFDPVAAFFASWIGYHMLHATKRHDLVSGRLRGEVVPQLTFEDDPISGWLLRQEPIERIRFELDMNPPEAPLGQQIRSAHLMAFWCQQMFGHGYELARDAIEDRYGSDRRRSWPALFQFAYHIRNGCFHGNTFDIRPGAISTQVPTEWRGKRIDYPRNGQQVALGFLGPADFITLLHDMQGAL